MLASYIITYIIIMYVHTYVRMHVISGAHSLRERKGTWDTLYVGVSIEILNYIVKHTVIVNENTEKCHSLRVRLSCWAQRSA